MPDRGMSHKDWREDLRWFLVTAKLQGRSQSEIMARFARVVNSDQINEELRCLHLEDKIQQFRLGKTGRKRTVWRATTKIMADI